MVMQSDGGGTPAQAGTDDNDWVRVVNKTCLDVI